MCQGVLERPSLLQHLKIHEGIEHQCDKYGYKSQSKKYLKDLINRIHSGINIQCNQCKIAFTEMGRLRTHTRFEHYKIQFLQLDTNITCFTQVRSHSVLNIVERRFPRKLGKG